jgi:hypothetical protein
MLGKKVLLAYIGGNDTFLSLPPEPNDLSLFSLNQALQDKKKNKLFIPKLNWKNVEVLKLYNLCDF